MNTSLPSKTLPRLPTDLRTKASSERLVSSISPLTLQVFYSNHVLCPLCFHNQAGSRESSGTLPVEVRAEPSPGDPGLTAPARRSRRSRLRIGLTALLAPLEAVVRREGGHPQRVWLP